MVVASLARGWEEGETQTTRYENNINVVVENAKER